MGKLEVRLDKGIGIDSWISCCDSYIGADRLLVVLTTPLGGDTLDLLKVVDDDCNFLTWVESVVGRILPGETTTLVFKAGALDRIPPG
jgi:hypothetical protein